MQRVKNFLQASLLIAVLCCVFPAFTLAAPPIINYEGRLLDATGVPVTETKMFRFSFWQSADFVSSDLDGAGAIETTAPNYSDWQEEQTITPNANGAFSVQLGSITPIVNISVNLHRFLQVEIKDVGAPDTAYELIDKTGDNGVDTVDRETIASVPFALRAGDANKTQREEFIIDDDDTAGAGDTIKLSFGGTLGKFLAYDIDNDYFRFNSDVRVEGDLTVTGLINGLDLTALAGGHAQNTDTGTDSPTFTINMTGNELVLSSAGLTASRTITVPDADTTLLGADTVQTVTNKTLDGNDNTFTNLDIAALKDRNKTLLLTPEYNNLTILEDGLDNAASLYQGYDTASGQQYYSLSSAQGTLQHLDLQVEVLLPEDFQGWQSTPVELFTRTTTTDTAQNSIDLSLEDTTGTDVSLSGGNDMVSILPGVWTEQAVTFGGTPVFTAGETIILRLRLSAHSGNFAAIGQIRLNYIGK